MLFRYVYANYSQILLLQSVRRRVARSVSVIVRFSLDPMERLEMRMSFLNIPYIH